MLRCKTRGLTLLEAVLVVAIFGMLGALLVSSLRMSLRSSQKIESHTIEGTSLSLFYVNLVRQITTSDLNTVAISEDGRLLSFGGAEGISKGISSITPGFDRIVIYYFDENEKKLCFANYWIHGASGSTVKQAVNLLAVDDWNALQGATAVSNSVNYGNIMRVNLREEDDLNTYVDDITPQKVLLEHVELASFSLNDTETTLVVNVTLSEKNNSKQTHNYTLLIPVLNPQ